MCNGILQQKQTRALDFLKSPVARRDWSDFYDMVLNCPPVPLGGNQWLLARRVDVLPAMRSPASDVAALYPVTRSPALNALLLGMLPFQTGAVHRRLRGLTRPLMVSGALASLEEYLSSLIESLLFPAAFSYVGCDVLTGLGERIPEAVSCMLLDVAPDDWSMIGHWARVIYGQMGRYDQSDSEINAVEALHAKFRAYVLERAAGGPGTRFAGVGEALLNAHRLGEIDGDELAAYFALFLLTGLDTLTHAIGNSVWWLGRSPDVFATIRARPDLIPAAFDEAMRLWGPVRLCVRHIQKDIHLRDGVLPAGSIAFLLLHAAARDLTDRERTDSTGWERSDGENFAFGIGPHRCLGTALGKLIGRSLFRSLALNCGSLLTGPVDGELHFIPSLPILGIGAVQLFATPA